MRQRLLAGALVVSGLVVLGIGAIAWDLHCWDICDPASEDWMSRAGAWEPKVQFALAAAFAVLVAGAAVLLWRRHAVPAIWLLAASVPVLAAWLVILIEPG